MWVASAASGLAVGALVLAGSLAWHNHALRGQLSATREQAANATAQVASLRSEQAATAAELDSQKQQLAALQADMTTLQQNADGASSPRLVRARIFAGGQYYGMGWVQTTPAGTNTVPGGLATVVADQAATPPPSGAWANQPTQTAAAGSFTQTYQYWPYLYTVGWIDGYWPTNREPRPPFAPSPSTDPLPPTLTANAPLPPATPARMTPPATSRFQRLLPTRIPLRVQTPFPTPGVPTGVQSRTVLPVPRQVPGAPSVAGATMATANRPLLRSLPTSASGSPWQR